MKKEESPLDLPKDMWKFMKEMTTYYNVIGVIVLWASLAVIALVVAGLVTAGVEGYQYVSSLYREAEAGDKLAVIVALTCLPLGALIQVSFTKILKRKADKKTPSKT